MVPLGASAQPRSGASHRSAQRRRGLLLVAGAATVWSSGGAIARLLDTPEWTTVFWRSLFAGTFLLGYIALREKGRVVAPFRAMGLAGIVVGCAMAAASTLFILALQRTSVAHILILLAATPLFAALAAYLVLGETVGRSGWLAMLAALCGIALMVADGARRGELVGDLIAFGIPLSFSLAFVATRHRPAVRMTPAGVVATLISGCIALILADSLAASPGDMGLLALFGAGQFACGMILFTAGARLVPAADAALVGLLETILGPLWVWLAFGENPGLLALAGGAIVLAAMATQSLLGLRRDAMLPPGP